MHLVLQLGGPLDVSSLSLDKQRVNDPDILGRDAHLARTLVVLVSTTRKMERSRDMVLDVRRSQRRNHRLRNTHLDV